MLLIFQYNPAEAMLKYLYDEVVLILNAINFDEKIYFGKILTIGFSSI
jgi:hypothetical protein